MTSEQPAILVVGAGVAGIRAALELAQTEHQVYLVDTAPNIGGTLSQLDKQFPTNHCGMCKMLPTLSRSVVQEFCLRRDLNHPNIMVMPLSEVVALEGGAGKFEATLIRRARWVNPDRCTACGRCVEACPVEIPDPFNAPLGRRKAIGIRYPLAIPNIYSIDKEACTRCGACIGRCPTGAIDLSAGDVATTIPCGAVILSTGFDEFDPAPLGQFGYGRYPNVVTSMEFERLLSGMGPTAAALLRPSEGKPVRSIAFLQCIGSRERKRDYCSSACCMYAMKEAMLAKDIDPGIEATIFFMDMRAFGRGYHRYYERAKNEYGIEFSRCRVSRVKQRAVSKNLELSVPDGHGRFSKREFDLVVLSIGQIPSQGNAEFLERLGIDVNEWGFCRTNEFSPARTSRAGVFVCGSLAGPKDINDCMTEACAGAAEASLVMHEHFGRAFYFGETAVASGQPAAGARIGFFVCGCGGEISGRLGTDALVEWAARRRGVHYAAETPLLCFGEELEGAVEAAKRERLDRVVVAACVPYGFKGRFEKAFAKALIRPEFVRIVNVREHVAWVHEDRAAATDKAKSLSGAAIEDLRWETRSVRTPELLKQRVLVIGGGLCGMASAAALGRYGFEVHLIEKSKSLGGNVRDIRCTLETPDVAQVFGRILREVEASDRVHIHLESEVSGVEGHVGNFTSKITARGQWLMSLEHGAIVVATGGRERKPSSYLYGKDERVVTEHEFEKMLWEPGFEKSDIKNVVMIQCVESRDEARPYCSRICCSQALKNAHRLKELVPEARVAILNRDVMAYGFREQWYTKAREDGVVFVRYEPSRKPEVSTKDGKLTVSVSDPYLEADFTFEPDVVVLSTGVEPNDAGGLASVLGVELDEDGFFSEAEVKFRPLDFLREGIFVCGLAAGPCEVREALAQGGGVVQRVISTLARGRADAARMVSEVSERRCAGCELCITSCPYSARVKDVRRNVAKVIEACCQGCGVCAMVCPSGASTLRGLSDRQVFAMLDAAVE